MYVIIYHSKNIIDHEQEDSDHRRRNLGTAIAEDL
jgi:hypothetical protein